MLWMNCWKLARKAKAGKELALITVQQMKKVRVPRRSLLLQMDNWSLYNKLIIRQEPRSYNIRFHILAPQPEASNKLHGYPRISPKTQVPKPKAHNKEEWKIKKETSALIAHTSLRVSSKEDWYFDSGCSTHVTGVKNFLVDLKAYSTSYVTFGDGAKGIIKGIGKLVRPRSPCLDYVFLAEGLNANLISIC